MHHVSRLSSINAKRFLLQSLYVLTFKRAFFNLSLIGFNDTNHCGVARYIIGRCVLQSCGY